MTRLPQAEHFQLVQAGCHRHNLVRPAIRACLAGQQHVWLRKFTAADRTQHLGCTWLPCRYCVILLRQAEVLHDLTLASAGQAPQPACTGIGTSSSSPGTSLLLHALLSVEPASNTMFHDVSLLDLQERVESDLGGCA